MRKALRWVGLALGVVVVLVVVAPLALYAVGGWKLSRTFDVQPQPVAIPTGAAAVERGRHLAASVGVCATCHGANLEGQVMVDDPGLGVVRTPNLTAGRNGAGARYSDADWVRAIRYGVRPDGRGLVFMPVDYFHQLNDEDLGALIAYIKSLPPVDTPPAQLKFAFRSQAMIGAGLFGEVMRTAEIDRSARPAPPASQGQYLAATAGCTFCHGQDFGGGQGPEPGAPPGPNLTRGGELRSWSEDDFIRTLRTGETPYGKRIAPPFMPWQSYRNMTDEELRALWVYLQSLPPVTAR